ncbi:MAG: hypothetical protein ACPLXR_06750 [Halothiobacillaceae bacterium]
MDTLGDGTPFAEGSVAGIGGQVVAISISDESSDKEALDHFGACAAAQGGRQGFDVAVGPAGGGLEDGGLGFGEFGLSSHVDLR